MAGELMASLKKQNENKKKKKKREKADKYQLTITLG
jgi:hypothetical protein